MQTIAKIALEAVQGKRRGFPLIPGRCLHLAFEALAQATNTNRWVLYDRVLDRTGVDADRSRWATDAERGIDRLNWEVSKVDFDPRRADHRAQLLKLLKPGDFVFSSRAGDEAPTSPRTAPDVEGHVGVYVGVVEGIPCVAENTRAARGQRFRGAGAMRLTPLADWDTVTTIGRVPAGWRP
ncbi:MAG: hypothetical protein SFU83_23430 [Meiothermus sp.]|nr:hypothetical protein [Meiothermus sp.]